MLADSVTVRLASGAPAGSKFWIGNVTVAVSPPATAAVLPAWIPISLTGLSIGVATPVEGESKQVWKPLSQSTAAVGLSTSPIVSTRVARKPITARQRNGPRNGAPFAPGGRVNSGEIVVERSAGLVGSNARSVDR